jgi:hypothetical protein
MAHRSFPPLILLAALQLAAGRLPAQSVLPRAFGPLRLGMALRELTRQIPNLRVTCADECLPAEEQVSVGFDRMPGARTALVALGYDSAAMGAQDGVDCTFYHGRLVRMTLPPPAMGLDSAVHRLVAQLGPYRTIAVWPSGAGAIGWTDRVTDIKVTYSFPPTAMFPDASRDHAQYLAVVDRRADSLMAAATSERGPVH